MMSSRVPFLFKFINTIIFARRCETYDDDDDREATIKKKRAEEVKVLNERIGRC